MLSVCRHSNKGLPEQWLHSHSTVVYSLYSQDYSVSACANLNVHRDTQMPPNTRTLGMFSSVMSKHIMSKGSQSLNTLLLFWN